MSLAIIDISPLRNGGDTQSVARQIGEACRSIGFFYATGHGVDERLIERVYHQAAAFHALPQVEKERYHIALSRNHRGYVPPGEEDYGSEPGTGLKESFDLAADLPTRANSLRDAPNLSLYVSSLAGPIAMRRGIDETVVCSLLSTVLLAVSRLGIDRVRKALS